MRNCNYRVAAWLCRIVIVMAFMAPAGAALAQTAVKDIKRDVMMYDFAAALSNCEKLYASGNSSLEIALLYAETLSASGDFDKSSKIYEAALSRFPESIKAYEKAAAFFLSRIKFAKASEIYKSGLEKLLKNDGMYNAQKSDSSEFFRDLTAYYKKFNLKSEEVQFYYRTGELLGAKAPALFKKSISYFKDTGDYASAVKLIETLKADKNADAVAILSLEVELYEEMVKNKVEPAKNITKTEELYEALIADEKISVDRKITLLTAYYNFLQDNANYNKKMEKYRSGLKENKLSGAGLFIAAALLMQRDSYGEFGEFLEAYLKNAKKEEVFKNHVAVAKLLRSHGRNLKSMKVLFGAYEAASTNVEKADLYYEMASNLSGFYYLDLRYLTFKSMAVDCIEKSCDDFMINAVMALNSRRFLRYKFDDLRVALRQFISRHGAILYYERILSEAPEVNYKDRIYSELGELYAKTGQIEKSFVMSEKLWKEFPDSVYVSGALKNMIVRFQSNPRDESKVSDSANLIDGYLKERGESGMEKMKDALIQLMRGNSDNEYSSEGNFNSLYFEKVYEYIEKLSFKYPGSSWLRSQYISMIQRSRHTIGQKISALDGLLKAYPYDREVLRAKESVIRAELNSMWLQSVGEMLENFYRENYFVDQAYLKGYLEMMAKNKTLDASIEKLLKENSANPGKPLKIKLIADCYFFISNFEEAEKWYDEYLKLVRTDTSVLLKQSSLKRSFGKNEEALRLLEKLIETEPSSKKWYVTAGDVIAMADKGKDLSKADAYFRKIIEIDPENNENYVELATIYWDYFKYDEGLELLRSRREKAKNDYIFGREMANLFELTGSTEVAVPEYISVICAPSESEPQEVWREESEDGRPDENDMDRPGRRYSHYNYRYERPESADVMECRARLVTLYGRSSRKKDIDAAFEKLIKSGVNTYRLAYEYAKILMEYELNEKALECITKASECASKSHELMQLANLLEKMNRIAQAKELYYKALKISPEDASLYQDALDFFKRFNLSDDYIGTVKARAENFSENSSYAEQYALYLMKQKSSTGMENYKKAAAIYEKLIEKSPTRVKYRNLMCDVIIKLQGIDKAIAYIEGLINNNPAGKKGFNPDDITKLRETRARLLAKSGKIDEVLEIYKGLIYENPGEPTFPEMLASLAADPKRYDQISKFIENLDGKKVSQAAGLLISAKFNARLKKTETAIDTYKKLNTVTPGIFANARALYQLYLDSKKYDECKKMVPSLTKMAANENDYSMADYYCEFARPYLATGDTAGADLLYDEHLSNVLERWKNSKTGDSNYCSNYVEALEKFTGQLRSAAYYESAIVRLKEKIKHCDAATTVNENYKYKVDAANLEIADIYVIQGKNEEALDMISAAIEERLKTEKAANVPQELLKKAVDLWRCTGKYDENIKHYWKMAGSADGAEAGENASFLLGILKYANDWPNYMSFARSSMNYGAISNSIEHLEKGQPEKDNALAELLMLRIKLNENAVSRRETYVRDLQKCGLIYARKRQYEMAEAFFGMALKYDSSARQFWEIADRLLESDIRKLAYDYYDIALKKFTDKGYYQNAPVILKKLSENGDYAKAAQLIDDIRAKHPDDLKMKMAFIEAYAAMGRANDALDIINEILPKVVKISEIEVLLGHLEPLVTAGEFAKAVDRLIAEKIKDHKAGDYNMLFIKKLGAVIDMAEGSNEASIVAAVRDYIAYNPAPDKALAYFTRFFEMARNGDSRVKIIGRKAYLEIADLMAEALNYNKDEKLGALTLGETDSELQLLLEGMPRGVKFAGDLLPLLKKIRAKVYNFRPDTINSIFASGVEFADADGELMALYRECYDVTAESSAIIAQKFIEAGEYGHAAPFVELSLKLNDELEYAKLLWCKCLIESGKRDEALKAAASINPEKLREISYQPWQYDEEYYDGSNFLERGALELAGCFVKLERYSEAADLYRRTLAVYERDGYGRADAYHSASLGLLGVMLKTGENREFTQRIEADIDELIGRAIYYDADYAGVENAVEKYYKIYSKWLEERSTSENMVVADNMRPAGAYLEITRHFKAGRYAAATKLLQKYIKTYQSNPFILGLAIDYADDVEDESVIKSACWFLSNLMPHNSRRYDKVYFEQHAKRALAPKKLKSEESRESAGDEGENGNNGENR